MTIDLNPTPEQAQITDSMRKALGELLPTARLRGRHDGNDDAAHWAALAQLGAFGVSAPEAVGGSGFTVAEEVLLFVECGRVLLTPCAVATVVAARVAQSSGLQGIAAALVAGDARACVATFDGPSSTARIGDAALHLHDAIGADYALAWDGDGVALLRCDALERTTVAPADRSATLERCRVPAPQAILPHQPNPDAARHADLLVAAMRLGMAQACRDMATEYAQVRVQFGQPIGAFQAIKHRCADMAVDCEVLRAQLVFAALAVRDGWPDARLQVDAARLLASRTALDIARSNIQLHGAIGFTAECDAHLYLLREHRLRAFGGSHAALRDRLTDNRSG